MAQLPNEQLAPTEPIIYILFFVNQKAFLFFCCFLRENIVPSQAPKRIYLNIYAGIYLFFLFDFDTLSTLSSCTMSSQVYDALDDSWNTATTSCWSGLIHAGPQSVSLSFPSWAANASHTRKYVQRLVLCVQPIIRRSPKTTVGGLEPPRVWCWVQIRVLDHACGTQVSGQVGITRVVSTTVPSIGLPAESQSSSLSIGNNGDGRTQFTRKQHLGTLLSFTWPTYTRGTMKRIKL